MLFSARIFLLTGPQVALMLLVLIASPTGLFAQQSSAATKPQPAYNAKFWREKKGAITDRDRERLAKFTAYLGGRSSGAASLSMKDDKVFQEHLETNRLKLLDSIDNNTGLQVSLVKDLDTGRVFVLPRGTEFGSENKDVTQADFGGFYSGQLKIGKDQYVSGKKKIREWIRKYKGNVEVIGHSLGGAIAQRIVLDNAENIVSATVFNSPGLELKTVKDALGSASRLRKLMNDDGTRKLRVFNVGTDLVGAGGGLHILADIIMSQGGALDAGWKAAHTQLVFGPDVKRAPLDYFTYQSKRDRSEHFGEYAIKDLGRAIFNIINLKNPLQNDLRKLLSQLSDDENANLRRIDAIKRKKWKESKKKKSINEIVTAVIDGSQLDLETGKKKKPKKPPLQTSVPVKLKTKPAVAEDTVSVLTGAVGSFNVSKSGYKWLGQPGRMNGSVAITISGSNATANVDYEANDLIYIDYTGTASGTISGYFTREGKLVLAGKIPFHATDLPGCEATNRSGDQRTCQGWVNVWIKGQRVGNRLEGKWRFDGQHNGTWQSATVSELLLNPEEVAAFDRKLAKKIKEFEVGVENSNEYDLFKDALLGYFK